MSLHASKPQVEIQIRQQQRKSFITSLIISILTIILFMLLLSLLLLAPLFKDSPTIVTYESNLDDETQLEEKKIPVSMERKPSSPSSSMAKVIAANTDAPVTVPVPEVEVAVPSLEFGDGDDFGDGWGSGNGTGQGAGGGASFFNQKVKADRIAYVIDYSLSMNGTREALMRTELSKSVKGLADDMNYQLIFFAGPAWTAGDEVRIINGRKAATVESGSRTYEWTSNGTAHQWDPKGKKLQPDWIKCRTTVRKKSLEQIAETRLVWGTNWQPALEMAMAMEPPPQIIFFMTDGVTGGDSDSLARRIAAEAKTKKITITRLQ